MRELGKFNQTTREIIGKSKTKFTFFFVFLNTIRNNLTNLGQNLNMHFPKKLNAPCYAKLNEKYSKYFSQFLQCHSYLNCLSRKEKKLRTSSTLKMYGLTAPLNWQGVLRQAHLRQFHPADVPQDRKRAQSC